MTQNTASLNAIPYSQLPGWAADDHAAAYAAFRASAQQLLEIASAPGDGPAATPTPEHLLKRCRMAVDNNVTSGHAARTFFEEEFVPHRVSHTEPDGLLTGYYEPELDASRQRTEIYRVPIHRRPPDLVNLVSEAERGAKSSGLTHARKTSDGTEPYATRRQIELGALDGQGLELFYLADPVDVFFMHVQGSGQLRLPDGSKTRITYDGKNGHPYTSVGRYVVDQGWLSPEKISLQALANWLRAEPERGQKAMWQNNSYVFFRELTGDERKSPQGVLGIPLTPGRSLAVDTVFHVIGSPVFVSAPKLVHAGPPHGFNRLMVAHDVGSAITGPERGDLFFGTGKDAGRQAGTTLHRGNFFVLLPKQRPR